MKNIVENLQETMVRLIVWDAADHAHRAAAISAVEDLVQSSDGH